MVKIDSLRTLHPLARGVDPCIGAHCAYNGSCVYFDVARFLDNLFERGLHIALAFRKEAGRVSVPVHAGAIRQLVVLCGCYSTAPVDEVALDLLPQRMRANLAFRGVAAEI